MEAGWHVSRPGERNDVREVRANAFAAAFLLPEEGLRREVRDLDRGLPSRVHGWVFDEENFVEVTARPGEQDLSPEELARLEHQFGVSHNTRLYRLANLGLADPDRLTTPPDIIAKAASFLGLTAPDDGDAAREHLLALALEASRRGALTEDQLAAHAARVGADPGEVGSF